MRTVSYDQEVEDGATTVPAIPGTPGQASAAPAATGSAGGATRLPGDRARRGDHRSGLPVRALDTHQIQALFFPSASGRKAHSRCQRRLQLLFHRGLLWRAELPSRLSEGRRPLVYYLDRKGAELLAQRAGGELGALDWDPKAKDLHPEFLEHLLATNQVRIALVLAAHAQGWQITRWLDDATLKREQMKDYVTLKGPRGGHERAAVVPDGYWVLDTGQRLYHHFLEIDRGTVTGAASAWGRRDWARKVATYLEYDRPRAGIRRVTRHGPGGS